MEIRYLQSFLQVAKEGNYTKAAEQLGYSQGTITVQIKQLEEEIGAPLFQRIGNKNFLTPAGEKLIKYANQIMQINENIKNLTNNDPLAIQGSLRIHFIDSMTPIIAPVIKAYRETYPNVIVEITHAYNKDMYETLRKNETDIIFTMGNKVAPHHCLEVARIQESLCAFSASEHPLAKVENVTFKDICQYPLILWGRGAWLERELSAHADAHNLEFKSLLHTSSNTLLVDLVENNLGISFLSKKYLELYSKNNAIKVLPIEDFEYSYHITVYRNRNTWLSPQADGFLSLLSEHFASLTESE